MNKIITVASSWLFILLYQRCTVTQTSNLIDVLNKRKIVVLCVLSLTFLDARRKTNRMFARVPLIKFVLNL